MRRIDTLEILCKLTSGFQEYETESSQFLYELEGREYEISIKRIKGQLKYFEVTFHKEVKNEDN